MNVFDVTKEQDSCSSKTPDMVMKRIRGHGDVFGYGSPCTGGASRQGLNLEVAKREGRHGTIVSIIYLWDLHWRFCASFERIARHCKRVGATVLLEWPGFCGDWIEEKVARLLSLMCFQFTDFDGCTYSLVSIKGELFLKHPSEDRGELPSSIHKLIST